VVQLLVMMDNLTSFPLYQIGNISLALFHPDLACDGACNLTNKLTNLCAIYHVG
jgi:hypothetical protein